MSLSDLIFSLVDKRSKIFHIGSYFQELSVFEISSSLEILSSIHASSDMSTMWSIVETVMINEYNEQSLCCLPCFFDVYGMKSILRLKQRNRRDANVSFLFKTIEFAWFLR